MNIHSKILIHWTKPKTSPVTVEGYVQLLRSICSNGLRYSIPRKRDIVHGVAGAARLPRTPMICFTELRLRDVDAHTGRYGHLGIGFSRNSLLQERGANPVFYLPNIGQGVVSTNLKNIVSERSKITALDKFLCFVKPMSKFSQAPDKNLTNYDEMEWRMIWWESYKGKNGQGFRAEDFPWIRTICSTHYFAFTPIEVEIIVAPDKETKDAMFRDKSIREFFDVHFPMIVTADACSQF